MENLNHLGVTRFLGALKLTPRKFDKVAERRHQTRKIMADLEEALRKEEEAEAAEARHIEDTISAFQAIETKVAAHLETCKRYILQDAQRDNRALEKEIKALREENDKLRSQLNLNVKVQTEKDKEPIRRASTICVFDSLLFAIENWSTDGQVASDVSLCSQSILFPLIYEPVMKGDDDYYIETFPTVSLEIVRRGREFVKWLREESPTSLSDKDTWDVYADSVREWWVNDALPLIYGARSDDWVIESAFDYDQMVKWRDLPASRALEFPLIFDGMELVSKQMDNIRTPVGLPDFTKKQMQTRLEP